MISSKGDYIEGDLNFLNSFIYETEAKDLKLGKAMLIGGCWAGKSWLLQKLKTGEYKMWMPTIGIDYGIFCKGAYKLQLWDTNGLKI